MCVIVITPQESASGAAAKLQSAARALAQAQADVLDAAQTLAMFEKNFRLGWYMQKPNKQHEITPDESSQ